MSQDSNSRPESDSTAPTVLTVRVEPDEQFVDRSIAAVQALDRGERPDEYHGVSLNNADELGRLLSAKTVELLRIIAREEPDSIRELCRLVDRDISQVSDDLAELEALGIVELHRDGRAKRPRFEYDEIDIRVPIGDDAETDPAPV